MIYGAVITIILGILSYVQYLRTQLSKHQLEVSELKSQSRNKEWDDQISKSQAKVSEEVKDYEDAKKLFHDHYGTATSQPVHGSDPNTKPQSDT